MTLGHITLFLGSQKYNQPANSSFLSPLLLHVLEIYYTKATNIVRFTSIDVTNNVSKYG